MILLVHSQLLLVFQTDDLNMKCNQCVIFQNVDVNQANTITQKIHNAQYIYCRCRLSDAIPINRTAYRLSLHVKKIATPQLCYI